MCKKISILVVITVLFAGACFANELSPVSRFNPIAATKGKADSMDVSTGKTDLDHFARKFRFDSEFIYLTTIIAEAINADLSEDWVRSRARKMLSQADLEAVDVSGLTKRMGSFYLPYGGKAAGYPFVLRFTTPRRPAANPSGAPSFVVDGAIVYFEKPAGDAGKDSSAASLPITKNGAEGYIDDDTARASAVRFMDTLKLDARSAVAEKKTIILGIDLSFIPPEQMKMIMPTLNAIKDLSQRGAFVNVIIVRGKGGDLACDVLKAARRKGVDPSRVIVLANEAAAFGDVLANLKDTEVEDRLLVAGVKAGKIAKNQYVRIFDMLHMALRIAFNEAEAGHNPFIDVVMDPDNRRIIHFIPRAEPLSDDRLECVYQLQADLVAKSM